MWEPSDMVTQRCGEGLLARVDAARNIEMGESRRRWERKCRSLVACKVVEKLWCNCGGSGETSV